LRTFIAIEIPGQVRQAVYGLREVMPPGCAKIRWVKEKGIHLTLVFLGELSDNQVEMTRAVLSEVSKRYSPFPMALRGAGTFPNERRPRVLWAGVSAEATEPITNLYHDIAERLNFLKLEEKKRYTPHITFGRIKSVKDLKLLQQGIHALTLDTESFYVKAITLFKSELKPDGAEYTPLGQYPLSKNPT
jgi:2'-5' RNA ligase